MKIAWVFDLDNTLIFTDEKKNKETFFRNLDVISYDNKMLSLFTQLKAKIKSVFIVTGRHPDLQRKIADMFDLRLERVKCRQNDLERYKEKLFVEGGQELQYYFEKMNDWKVSVLNQMTIFYDLVIYFDDGFKWYLGRKDLEPNVFILPPVEESYRNIIKLDTQKDVIKNELGFTFEDLRHPEVEEMEVINKGETLKKLDNILKESNNFQKLHNAIWNLKRNLMEK